MSLWLICSPGAVGAVFVRAATAVLAAAGYGQSGCDGCVHTKGAAQVAGYTLIV
jgi:hypothetical protein